MVALENGGKLSGCPLVLSAPGLAVVTDRLSLRWRVMEKDSHSRWVVSHSSLNRRDLITFLDRRRLINAAMRSKLRKLPAYVGGRPAL